MQHILCHGGICLHVGGRLAVLHAHGEVVCFFLGVGGFVVAGENAHGGAVFCILYVKIEEGTHMFEKFP